MKKLFLYAFCCLILLVSEVVIAADYAIVTPNSYATRAGRKILEEGGSASDAALAAYMVLGLVMPQSVSIAGGGVVYRYDGKSGESDIFDILEISPAQAGRYLFVGKDGLPMSEQYAVVGGRSVGVPGIPALAGILNKKFGKTDWINLFLPAYDLAEKGFEVSSELEQAITKDMRFIGKYSEGRQYFLNAFGNPRKEGEILHNPAYAELMKKFMTEGYDAFYDELFAKGIVEAVQKRAYDNRGLLSVEDLSEYMAVRREPLCIKYRNYSVCSAGQPFSEGMWLIETLGILDNVDFKGMKIDDPQMWHMVAQAAYKAYADRSMYAGDPNINNVDVSKLFSREYLKQRSEGIGPDIVDLSKIKAGDISERKFWPDSRVMGQAGEAVIAVDNEGNVVSIIAGIQKPFGSRLFFNGVLMNSALASFSFSPTGGEGDFPVINRAEGNKRPRSPMTPVFVFDKAGKPLLVLGASGGSRNVSRLLQRVIAYVDANVGAKDLYEIPDIAILSDIEISSGNGTMPRQLEKLGHVVRGMTFDSNISVVEIGDSEVNTFPVRGIVPPRKPVRPNLELH